MAEPNLSRRGFLRGLVAAAVAAKVTTLTAPEAEAFIDSTTDQLLKIRVNGMQIKNLDISDAGQGWFRVMANFKAPKDQWPWIEMDFLKVNDGKGIFVGDEKHCIQYMANNPGHVAMVSPVMNNADYTFSCYVKRTGPKGLNLYVPTLEQKA